MANQRSGFFLGGVLVGTAIGAVVGVLLAPRSGRETRSMLKKSADALPELVEDLADSLQVHTDRLSEAARVSWDDTLERLREAIQDGLEVSQQQRQALQTALEQPDPDETLDDEEVVKL